MNIKSGTHINRYIIEKPLSDHGGTAKVFLAHLDKDEKLKVALKISLTDENSKAHEDLLLEREAQLLQGDGWRHPGIVRVFPSPVPGSKPRYHVRTVDLPSSPYFMVMEYLSGKSLSDQLRTIQSYPLEWKLELFYQILVAVSFIHSKGYGHRDLKPDNVVFRDPISPNHLPKPVLIDFALASKNGQETFDVIEKSLTIDYSPPEGIAKSEGVKVTCDFMQWDVWSLGLIFYEILTGRFPISGNREQVRTTIIRERLKPVLPDGGDYQLLQEFISGMLNREMDKRPTVDLIIKALEGNFLAPRIPIQ